MEPSFFKLLLWSLLYILPFTSAFPTSGVAADWRKRDVDQKTIYYYNVDAAGHQAKFNDLLPKGYRMISLNVYGPASTVRYSAVWAKRATNTGYFAIHNVNAAKYQEWFDKYSAQGYVSTSISATGPRNSATYAGVMEKIPVSSWFQRCDMTPNDFAGNNQAARANRQILKSFKEYGTAADPRICAVWHANPNLDKFSVLPPSYSSAGYQEFFNSETSKPYWHVSHISVNENFGYSALFTDTRIGSSWNARHGLTGTDLDNEVKVQEQAGRYPIHISGAGAGSSARFAAIFAPQNDISPRTWRVTGNGVTGFKNNAAASTSTEQTIQSFMKNSGVRQVQLSIAKNGVPLLDKAYTWSEAERKTTTINDPFLLASVSKAFVASAIQSLYNNGKLSPTTKVYPLLGYNTVPAGGDARALTITVQHLLDHLGGYNRDVSGDPTYRMRDIALAQSNGNRPATMKDVIDYMWARPLDVAPGIEYHYSNYGYLLLSYIVEKVSQKPYFTYLTDTIINPQGLTNVKPWLTDPLTHTNDNVIPESVNTGLSARAPLSPYAVADIFGGDGQFKDSCVGPAALSASASSLAKFAFKNAAWGNGPRSPGSARSGSTPGARSWIQSRWDGVDWAMNVNTRDFPNGPDTDFDAVVQAVNTWLDTNPTL